MRSATMILVILLCSTVLISQSTEASLQSALEGLHAKWFRAYDSGDGATMDQMEMDKLMLVMPSGLVWTKTKARSSEKRQSHPQTERALTDVSVRRFGDTAILTRYPGHQVARGQLEGRDHRCVRTKLREVEGSVGTVDAGHESMSAGAFHSSRSLR